MSDKKIVSFVDEDGEEMELELVEELEIEGVKYALLAPEGEEDEAYVYRMVEKDGEIKYEVVEDDDEFEMVLEEYNSMFDEE